jgi:hypothetical protein
MAQYPGSLSARAAKAGQSKSAFAEANIHADGIVGKLARIAYIGQGVHGGGKSNMASGGDGPRSLGERLYQVG